MGKKTQAGLELLAILTMIFVFSIGLNRIFFSAGENAMEISAREAMVSKCLDFNSMISRISINQGLFARIELPYSFQINASAGLAIISSDDESYTCALSIKMIKNALNETNFFIGNGERQIIHENNWVIVI